ncbi:MAG TPA: rhamnogalacturonan acetylesterase [Chitinophagaceae bacterium]|jgi:lysophospholipase L1-like esterase|nr:rhamnogalacturonan acetylesterase [Chitinophagaceae bacterium]
MISNKRRDLFLAAAFILLSSFIILNKDDRKPVLFIIGDSTVKNGRGDGAGNMWGWGDLISPLFDTTKIKIENDALGGTSSRTFLIKGLWDKVLSKVQKGDYVIMQFGHNDSGPLDDTARARGTIKGVSDSVKEVYNPITKQQEVVHTYGWYLAKIANDAKAKGATVFICSPIPRNDWKEGKVTRYNETGYGLWAKQTAESTGAYFIDLNNLIADEYDAMGKEKVNPFFPNDHTHTSRDGATLNAACVVKGIRELKKCDLKKYLLK